LGGISTIKLAQALPKQALSRVFPGFLQQLRARAKTFGQFRTHELRESARFRQER
jgi:hypothetical protein